MAQARHLSNAPIIEAVIDVQVEMPESFDVAKLAAAGKALGVGYQPPVPVNGFEANFSFDVQKGEKPVINPTIKLQGYNYQSRDRGYIAAFKTTGFSFSRLPPYTDWDDLFAHASAAWSVYLDIVKPPTVTRIALRYINRLFLPISLIVPLSKFIEVPIHVPDKLSPLLNGFFTRAGLHDPKTGMLSLVMFATESPTVDGRASLLFDIDVSITERIIINTNLFPEKFKQLRDSKNDIFFSHLTEECVTILQ